MGNNNSWKKIKNEYLGRIYASICGFIIILITISILFFIASKGLQTFIKDGYSISDIFFSANWKPSGETPAFGALAFIIGSTLVSFGAVIISAPVAIAVAIFMNVISKGVGRKIIQPALELFVGIPSVVYGWIGVSLLVPLIKSNFGGIGFSLLAGIIVLSIMILPTIATISSDAIKSMPKDYVEASYGLGATRWQTITKVIIPSTKNGILTGVVLGVARAFGEALAVQMVIGNAPKVADGLLSTTSTLTSVLTMDMANTASGTPWNDVLWTLALILLIISFIFILIIRKIGSRGEE